MAAGIKCTTLARIKHHFKAYASDNTDRDAQVVRIIQSVSTEFETYLRRYLLAMERTEYYDVEANQVEWFLRGIPISAAEFYYDMDRTWATALDSDNVLISKPYSDAVAIVDYSMTPGRSYVKIVYTGGMATSTNQISTVLSSDSGTFVAGEDVKIATTVYGVVVSWNATTKVLVWTPVVTSPDAEQGGTSIGDVLVGDPSGATGTIASYSTSNFMTEYPDIARAAETQVVHDLATKDHPGMTTISRGGESLVVRYDRSRFLKQVCEDLAPYRRPLIGL